ncbi:MAG: pyruvate ferredoxin oxidoreductase [bacterium (Candidatus Stahlbacteria) CG08_land_8_20_14_0_20_40_26]|nr:MAG: pyruvate ferredoxin oxidoreductase [bacterium (Candidatus Stahlbacteria) CG23_combo_of_CG06-09_8_20_14_all_40_9]PIS23765.1 MAG: pyruvate ferredoxin oxidoreductase [bacterium (Candidatus Stahlbacteria) CG08_land_8_20_14_0_20_40_26]
MPMKALTGNEAMAEAMRQINPDVVAAYPITPATEVVQLFASFVADGLVDTEFVAVESEHSAMSACIGASAAGGRVITSTSSQGLALMHEVLYIAAALRLPIVICEVNRSLSAPINIHCDHSDTMGSRESGWMHIFAEESQEAYDSIIQAMKIAEHVYLPMMVSTDGFIISHCMQRIDMLRDKEVKDFIGKYKPHHSLLLTDKPYTVGPLDLQDYYFEHKRQQIETMMNAAPVIKKVGREFGEKFGRYYGLFEEYKMRDADNVVIAAGSAAGTAKAAVEEAREKGMKAGLLRIRVMRPFPHKEIANALKDKKIISVLDRSDSMSTMGGPIFVEMKSALYDIKNHLPMCNYIYGLGGREIDVEDIIRVFKRGEVYKEKGIEKKIDFVGLRE